MQIKTDMEAPVSSPFLGYIQSVRLRSTLLKQSWPFFKNLLIMAWYRLCMEWSWSLSHIHTMCQL